MPYDLSTWLVYITDKPPEAWLAVLLGSAYVWRKSGNIGKKAKFTESSLSGFFSIVIGPDVSLASGYPTATIHFALAVYGFTALDVVSSVFSDKAELKVMFKDFVRHWMGIKDGGKQ